MRSNEFMNAEDVARYLNLGKNTVYQLAKSGKLSSYHVGRKLKFTLEDVEAYVASTHHKAPVPASFQANAEMANEGDASTGRVQAITDAASFGELEGDPFVVAGGDVFADYLASSLNASGYSASRLVQGSYTALVNLYAGDADAAVVHLFDQKSNSYNVPYARSLAPGASVKIYRVYGREQGLIVRAGNPKKLTTWGGLLREGVRLSNRMKGSGSRVLLDEKLRAMDARAEYIEGYDSQSDVARSALKRVTNGIADVAVGTEREAMHHPGLEFVSLQMEWVDLVVAKREGTRDVQRAISSLLLDDDFRQGVEALGPCDTSSLGNVIYES